MTRTTTIRARLTAVAGAGLLFAAYPVTRPYSDEKTLDGAHALASPAWVAAHTFAMIAFVLLALGLPALRVLGGRQAADRPGTTGAGEAGPGGSAPGPVAALLAALGAGFVLPYYGAEAFGLHAIAERVVATGDVGLLALVDRVRYQPVAITLFGAGLVLLAASGVLVGMQLWRAGGVLRWGAVLLAAGLVLFLPQFFAPAPLRIGHGLVLAAGCLLVATSGWRRVGSTQIGH